MNRWLVKRNDFGNEIDNFFNNFFQAPFFNLEASNEYSPRVNVIDSENELTFVFELPGMDKEAIKVLVQDNILTVSGERKYKSEVKDDKLIRTEIRQGSFKRSFTLPDSVEVKDVLAEYKNGLLEIKLTKKEEAKPKEVNVKIS
jgi:HSP20 family protein